MLTFHHRLQLTASTLNSHLRRKIRKKTCPIYCLLHNTKLDSRHIISIRPSTPPLFLHSSHHLATTISSSSPNITLLHPLFKKPRSSPTLHHIHDRTICSDQHHPYVKPPYYHQHHPYSSIPTTKRHHHLYYLQER